MTPVFLDSGYLIALEVADDQHHEEAMRHWSAFVQPKVSLVTTSSVLDEVVTGFMKRGKHAKAVEVAERMLSSPMVEVVYVDDELFGAALDYLKRRPDKKYSFTDCVSFVTMQRLEIRAALAFDHHFEQAGFRRLPLEPG